jgi:diaminopimelate decarboxylase
MLTQTDKALDLAERLGGEREGEFAPSGVPISEIAREYGTPFYLYHGETIVERVRRVREALGHGGLLLVKANPSLGVCQLIAREREAGAEVASSGELAVARAAGFEPEDIVFAGPGKTDDELRRVVEEGIFADNVESLGEIDRLAGIAGRPGPHGRGPQDQPGGPAHGERDAHGRHGRPVRHRPGRPRRGVGEGPLPREPVLRGVHVYTATQVFEVDPLLEHCRNIFDIALEAADHAGHRWR